MSKKRRRPHFTNMLLKEFRGRQPSVDALVVACQICLRDRFEDDIRLMTDRLSAQAPENEEQCAQLVYTVRCWAKDLVSTIRPSNEHMEWGLSTLASVGDLEQELTDQLTMVVLTELGSSFSLNPYC